MSSSEFMHYINTSDMQNASRIISVPFPGFFSGISKHFRPLEDLKLLLDGVGKTLAVMVNGLVFAIKTIKSLKGVGSKLFTGDFSGAWDFLKGETVENFKSMMSKSIQAFTPKNEAANNIQSPSPGNAAVNKSISVNNRMDIGGKIKVQAEKGTRIVSANVKANTGSNMAMIGGL